MLEVKFNDIEFQNRLIVKSGSIKIPRKCITVLSGKSGIGKTSLIKAIILQNKFASEILLDNEIVFSDDFDSNDYVLNHISYIAQNPQFITDLTINEHIELYSELFPNSTVMDSFRRLLNIDSLLSKYPMQLSGGEKKRTAFYLAILKGSEYIILDEPTSSLDCAYIKQYIIIFDMLKEQGKGILFTTHDVDLINKATLKYEIENKELKIKNESDADTIPQSEIMYKKVLNISGITKHLLKTRKHKKTYQRMMTIFSIICISFIALSFGFDSYNTAINYSTLDKVGSKYMVVYKTDEGIQATSYAFNGFGKAINDDERRKLEETEHVSSVDWRFDINLLDYSTVYLPKRLNEKNEFINEIPKISIVNKDKVITDLDIQGYGGVFFSTFNEKALENKMLIKDFHKEGIYLSYDFAVMMGINFDTLENMEMKLTLQIPQFSCYGCVLSVMDDIEKKVTTPINQPLEVSLPIAGVLKGNSVEIPNSMGNVIYMKKSMFQKYVEQFDTNTKEILYFTKIKDKSGKEINQIFKNEFPYSFDNPEFLKVVKSEYLPWNPSAYTIEVDSTNHVQNVIEDLSKKGYNIYNEYANYNALSSGDKNLQQIIKTSSIISSIIIFLIYFLIAYNNKDKQTEINDFLFTSGLSKKEILQAKKCLYRKLMLQKFLLCFATLLILFIIGKIIEIISFHITILMILLILGLSFLLEYAIPMAAERKRI